jgi:hypothetical protein
VLIFLPTHIRTPAAMLMTKPMTARINDQLKENDNLLILTANSTIPIIANSPEINKSQG